jgi:hypothetical protein
VAAVTIQPVQVVRAAEIHLTEEAQELERLTKDLRVETTKAVAAALVRLEKQMEHH